MKQFPDQIPVFPLSGVIYFPKKNLPLNIFEQRYLDLVNDIINKDKLMGMIQEKKGGKDLYKVGCLGKISEFKKSQDGRILINLTGITRFEILKEKKNSKLYREFKVDYKKLDIAQRINTLSMIAPITNEEKQKLLESISLKEKAKSLEDIMKFYLHETRFDSRTIQ